MNIGGVEKSFLTLSDQLIDKGNKVTIVTLNQNKNSLNQNHRIEIISLNTSRSILSLFKLSKMLNEKKPDILISAQLKICRPCSKLNLCVHRASNFCIF